MALLLVVVVLLAMIVGARHLSWTARGAAGAPEVAPLANEPGQQQVIEAAPSEWMVFEQVHEVQGRQLSAPMASPTPADDTNSTLVTPKSFNNEHPRDEERPEVSRPLGRRRRRAGASGERKYPVTTQSPVASRQSGSARAKLYKFQFREVASHNGALIC